MGNGLSPCLHLPAAGGAAAVRLVYWGGQARLLTSDDDDATTAGEVAGAGHVVCPADSFFVGLPVPVMSPGEELLPGRTYLVLPAARFPCLKVLTAATLAALSPAANGKKGSSLLAGQGGQCPFEYVKGGGGGDDGRQAGLIRVLPEFIERAITSTCDGGRRGGAAADKDELCSTPELKRHYAQLVGQRPWSPRLDTIAECGDKSSWLRSPAARLLLLASR